MKTFRGARWWALGAMTLGVLAVGLDLTVLSITLPTLAHAFHATESQLQWFTASYALALTAAILPAGLLADRYGRKRGLLVALGLFGLGSIFCSYAPSAEVFILARTLLGLAGAAIITMVLSALPVLFSESERPRAVGIWAAANFIAMPVGPILGGWILTYHWWGWVFLMNVPVTVIGITAILAFMPEFRSSSRPSIDSLGILLSSLGLAALTYGIIEAGEYGWSDYHTLLYLLSGLVVLFGFVLFEHWIGARDGQPLVDLTLFQSRAFVSGVVLMTLGTVPMAGLLFIAPQYFQGILQLTAQGSGVRLLPLIVGMVAGAVPADRLVAKIGAKFTSAVGFIVLSMGSWMAGGTGIHASSWFIAVWMVMIGAGSGMVMATAVAAALMEITPEHSGIATALMQAVKNLGLPFGTAILGSVLNHTYQTSVNVTGLSHGVLTAVKQSVFAGDQIAYHMRSISLLQSVFAAFGQGMDLAFFIAAGFAVAGCVIALLLMPHHNTEHKGAAEAAHQ